jgi:hypothetical protein
LNVKQIGAVVAGILLMALAAAHGLQPADKSPEAAAPLRLAEAPEKIYSDDANDSWNRIRLIGGC